MELQSGTVQALFFSQTNNPLYDSPVLQITSLSKFSIGSNDKNRYKANLSDGVHYMKAVFSSELSEMFDRNEIAKYYFIKLGIFSLRNKDNNNFLYVQNIIDFKKQTVEIGQSVNISSGIHSLEQSGTVKPAVESSSYKMKSQSPNENARNDIQSMPNTISYNKIPNTPKRSKTEDDITEIKKIFPHKKNFKFKGRVVFKSEIKKFNSQKGEGKVFSFEVADVSGQIKCVAFSEIADIFYPIIENNQVYTISNVTVKPSSKKFTTSTSDFEIHLERNSEVIKVEDDDIPKYMFKLVKISDLNSIDGIVDCIGVIKEVYPVSTIVIKATGKENAKRDLYIADQTGTCRLTIWGPKAEEEYEKDTVLCLKSVKTNDYNGISLSTIATTQIIRNVDIPETLELMSWYQEEGINVVIEKPVKAQKINAISEVKDNSFEYATIQASIMYIKEENLFYPSCSNEGCNKKVSMEDNGIFRCEKCNYTIDKCNYRYMANLNVSDFTGQMWITVFDENSRSIFGMTAEEMKELGDKNPEELHTHLKKLTSKEFQFRIKNKEENYNGDIKLRTNCLDVTHVDRLSETKKMLDVIEKVNLI